MMPGAQSWCSLPAQSVRHSPTGLAFCCYELLMKKLINSQSKKEMENLFEPPEDCNMGDGLLGNSEDCSQEVSRGGQYMCGFVEGGTCNEHASR